MTEPPSDDTTPNRAAPPTDDPLLEEQEHKGYGEDEGEREGALEDEETGGAA